MWRLLAKTGALFVFGVFVASFIPTPPVAVDTASPLTTVEAHPSLSTLATANVTIPNIPPTVVTGASINARFTGMLLHLKWLLKEGNHGGVSKELFDKQVDSILDNINDSNDSSGGTLPSTFVISDSGDVTAGAWLASVIADSYISDTLTIGASSVLADDLITPDNVLAAGQTDEYCLTYEGTADTWEWQTCGSGGGLATTSIDTSAELAAILTNETGTGALVFADSPTLTGTLTAAAANFSGNVGIGTSNPTALLDITGTSTITSGSGYGSRISYFINPASNSAAAYMGQSIGVTSSTSAADINYIYGIGSETYYQGSGTAGFVNGFYSYAGNSAAGTVTDLVAIAAGAENSDASGNIDTLKFLSVDDLYNVGTIGDTYGLYLGDLTDGTQTNAPYAIYSSDSGAKSYLAGNVGIGSTTPSAKLTVQNTTAGNSFIVEDQAGDTSPFVIDASGSIGIGTTPSTDIKSYLLSNRTDTSGYLVGQAVDLYANPGAASTAEFNAGAFFAGSESGATDVGGLLGLDTSAGHSGTGVLDYATGIIVGASNYSTGDVSAASAINAYVTNSNAGGTIIDARMIDIADISNVGTIDNTYGLYIGDLTDGTQTNAPFAIYSSDSTAKSYFAGNVGIGTTTPAQELQVFGDIRVGTAGGNGCLEDFAGTLISGTCSSDEDLKKDIEPIAQEGRSYLENLAALTPVTYTWNETAGELYSKDVDFENLGLIAQDVEAQFPELVSLNDEGYRQVNFSAFPFYIIEALKEVWQKIQGHDERINTLEQENIDLKNRLDEIEDELNIDVPPPATPEPTPEPPADPAPEPEPTPEPASDPTPEPGG